MSVTCDVLFSSLERNIFFFVNSLTKLGQFHFKVGQSRKTHQRKQTDKAGLKSSLFTAGIQFDLTTYACGMIVTHAQNRSPTLPQ